MANPDTSRATRYDQSAYKQTDDQYSLYAASQDQTLQAILELLKGMMGGNSPFMQEMGLVANALSGLGNSGVSSHAQISAGVRRHGVLGVSAGGSTGTIGGADVVSSQAASLLHKQMMDKFLDPITKQTTRGAAGLSQSELGQAIGLALKQGLGQQGAMFTQTADGKLAIGGSASSDAGLKQFEGEIAKTSGLLRSIKTFLGSPALQNLDSTLQDLFGNSLGTIGSSRAQAQVQKMMTFSNLHSPGDPNKTRSFILDGIAAGMAQRFGGPNMSAAEANYRYKGGMAGVATDIAIEAKAAAGHSAAAGSSRGPDRNLGSRSLEDIAETRSGLVADSMREEKAHMVGAYLARLQGGETKEEFDRLSQNLVNAGNNPAQVHKARMALNNFVERRSGKSVGSHDLLAISQMEGVQLEQAEMGRRIVQRRSNDSVRQALVRDAGTLGMSVEDASVVGMGFANLTRGQQVQLQEMLGKGDVDGAKALIQSELGGSLSAAGVDSKAFADRLTSGRFSGAQGQELLGRIPAFTESIAHFVSAGAAAEGRRDLMYQSFRDLRGAQNTPDVLRDLMSGLLGQSEFTDSQVLGMMADPKSMLSGGGIEKLKLGKDGTFDASEETAAQINRLTGLKLTAKDLATTEGQELAQQALRRKGTMSIEGQGDKAELLFASEENFAKAREQITTKGQQERLQNLHEVLGIEKSTSWKGGSKEAFDKLEEELIRKGDMGKVQANAFAAVAQAADLDAILSQEGMSKAEMSGKILGKGMSDADKDAMTRKLDEKIAEEEAKLQAINDSSDKYVDGDRNKGLNEEGKKEFDSAFKRKQALESIYKGLTGTEVKRNSVTDLYVTNMHVTKGGDGPLSRNGGTQ